MMELDPQLLYELRSAIQPDSVITTLANGKPNRIVEIRSDGVVIETERSRKLERDPELVPAWMLQTAWDHLRTTHRLSNRELLATDRLNVKRSSAVCALLAHLPGVVVSSSRPIVLEYTPSD